MMPARIDAAELRRQLDRMAAALLLEVDESIALNDGSLHAARHALGRMGIDPDSEAAGILLTPVRDAGIHRMLKGLPLSVRSAALKRDIRQQRPRTGYERATRPPSGS
jgi:hypothetical protein